jgi:hypothetical protein
MAMGAPNPSYPAGRVDELQRENEELREQLRRFSAQHTVVRGAMQEAATEKEATARMAHQVAVEERATRAAVEVQSSNIGFAVILQILNFFLLLIMMFGLFVWLPREVENRIPRPPVVAQPGTVTIPVR